MSKIEYNYFNKYISFLEENDSNCYSPIDYEEKSNDLVEKVVSEIDNNIYNSNFNSEFAVLNYLNGIIDKLELHIPNYFLYVDELEAHFNFYHEYTEGNYDPSFDVFESEEQRAPQIIRNFRNSYYKYLNYFNIYYIIDKLLDRKCKYSNDSKINFKYESCEELGAILEIKKIFNMVYRIIGKTYPYPIKEYFKNTPPIYNYFVRNEYFKGYKTQFIQTLNNCIENSKTLALLETFSYEIVKSKFLNQKIAIEKFCSKKEYLDTGIKDLLDAQYVIKKAKESNNPDLMYLTMSKKDFDIFFKDKNIDLEKYDTKRDKYINLFKYEIISDFYEIIQSYLQEVNNIEIQEKVLNKINANAIEPNPKKRKKSTSINKFKYYEIFDETHFEIFEKCYGEFENKTFQFSNFSAVFDILKKKKVIHNIVGHKVFREFLKVYSNGKIDLKPFKSPNENSKSPRYFIVNEFISGIYKTQ